MLFWSRYQTPAQIDRKPAAAIPKTQAQTEKAYRTIVALILICINLTPMLNVPKQKRPLT